MLLRMVGNILLRTFNRRLMYYSRVKVTHQSARTLPLLTFCKMFSLKAAHIQVDSMTAVSYLLKMDGTGSREMTALAKEI